MEDVQFPWLAPRWGWAGGDGAALHSQIGSVLGPAPSSLRVRAWQEQRGTETLPPPPCSWLSPSSTHPSHPGVKPAAGAVQASCHQLGLVPLAGLGRSLGQGFPRSPIQLQQLHVLRSPPAEEIPRVEVRCDAGMGQAAQRCGCGGVLPAALPSGAACIPQGCACPGGGRPSWGGRAGGCVM